VSGIFGFCYSCFEIRAITITQNLTEPDFLGRMFGILFLAIDAFQPVGSFVFGFVTDWLANLTLVIIGGCLLLGLWIINQWYQRLIRQD